jgi:hypothetical protein
MNFILNIYALVEYNIVIVHIFFGIYRTLKLKVLNFQKTNLKPGYI